MKPTFTRIFLWIVAIVLCKLAAYFMHWYRVEYGHEIVSAGYYKLSALHDLLAASLVYYLVRENKSYKIVAFSWVMLAVNQMLDELFFDPAKFQANELLFGVVVVIYSIVNLSRACRTNKIS